MITRAWLYLITAGLLEIAWALGLKYSDGFTKPLASGLTLISLIGSMWLLSLSVRDIPLGTAYAVWVGIGATGTALLGAALFSEAISPWRVLFLVLLVTSIIGLKITAVEPH
ncbi:MAG TPA: multidrug efflux SMR transporter [Polyangiaceae bacterium]|nr:multidrug efflux SMR transporter [Polyangiaceae bacterium]